MPMDTIGNRKTGHKKTADTLGGNIDGQLTWGLDYQDRFFNLFVFVPQD